MPSQLERLEFKPWDPHVPVLKHQKMLRLGKAQKAQITDDSVERHDALTKPQDRTTLACIGYSRKFGLVDQC